MPTTLKKIGVITLSFAMLISLSSCVSSVIGSFFDFGNPHSSNSVGFGTDVLATPILHEVYNQVQQSNAKVLSVYNSVGDIVISHSDSDNISVNMQLIQTKNLDDIYLKLESLALHPQNEGDVIYYEPLYAQDTSVHYWRWLRDELNANGIEVSMNIIIPASIQEIRIFGGIGDIIINDITAMIQAQIDIGTIIGNNVTPLDKSSFLVNTPSAPLGSDSIAISFASFEKTNQVIAGTTVGNIDITAPATEHYAHKLDTSINTKYVYKFNTDRLISYIREQCLAPSSVIRDKSYITEIVTVEEKDIIRNILVR